jgi:GT2 family glycosyltransferase/lipopolysaccharide/colanic/teichoic acid biosynthesis glycosyltransferase
MEISIVIVNFNVKHFLEQALLSIQKATESIPTEILVVDNASQDGSVAMVQEKFPAVKLIVNTQNKGFAAANNQALRLARGRYIACINPDTIIQEDTFSSLIHFFEAHPEAGMVGCKILNPDGTLQLACRRSFPTPWVAFTKISGLSQIFPQSRLFGRYNLTYRDPDATYEVEAISGSFMIFRQEALREVGLFDETWFMYGEDLDLCYRFRQAGWKIFYVPTTKIIHFKGESSKQSDFDTIRLFYQAMRLFVGKYHKSKMLQLVLILAIGLRAGVQFIRHFLQSMAAPLVDLFFLNLSLVLALLVRFGHLQFIRSYILVTIIYSTIWIVALFFSASYSKHRFAASYAIGAVLTGLVFITSLTFFLNQIAYSRAVVIIAGMFNLVFLAGWRIFFKLAAYWGFFRTPNAHAFGGRKTLVIGAERPAARLIEKLNRQVNGGYQITGVVSFESDDIGKQISGYAMLGTVDNLEAIIKRQKIQDVIFATEQMSYEKIIEVMHQGRGLAVNYRIVPDNLEVIIGKSSIDQLGELPLIEIDQRIDLPASIFFKRLFDMGIALFGLLLGLPWLIYWRVFRNVPIRRQAIWGENGQSVSLWLFADRKNIHRARYLPGLFSVLTGKISLVGAEIVSQQPGDADSSRKNPLKPGLTGLNQISRKRNLSATEKKQHDLYYMKNYSIILDLEILFKTFFKI